METNWANEAIVIEYPLCQSVNIGLKLLLSSSSMVSNAFFFQILSHQLAPHYRCINDRSMHRE